MPSLRISCNDMPGQYDGSDFFDILTNHMNLERFDLQMFFCYCYFSISTFPKELGKMAVFGRKQARILRIVAIMGPSLSDHISVVS